MSTTPTLKPSPHATKPLIGKLKSTAKSVEDFEVPIPAYILCTVGRSARCTTTLAHKYVGQLFKTIICGFVPSTDCPQANHQFSIQTFDEEDGTRGVYIVEEKAYDATHVSITRVSFRISNLMLHRSMISPCLPELLANSGTVTLSFLELAQRKAFLVSGSGRSVVIL